MELEWNWNGTGMELEWNGMVIWHTNTGYPMIGCDVWVREPYKQCPSRPGRTSVVQSSCHGVEVEWNGDVSQHVDILHGGGATSGYVRHTIVELDRPHPGVHYCGTEQT